jgi:hypothetical protein
VLSVVIVREGGRSSIPETLMIEPREPGVLDTRLRGYDSGGWARRRRVIAGMTAPNHAPLTLC